MSGEYIKEEKFIEKSEEEIQVEIIRAIIETKKQLEIANKNFEDAEGELIDYYSYQIKANRAKLDYLMKKAKSKSMEVDMINQLKIKLYQDKVV